MVIMTAQEHEQIIQAGHPDHCHSITIRNADYYILDFDPGVYRLSTSVGCPYLTTEKRCSIENEKPLICKAFPLMPSYIMNKSCPVVQNVTFSSTFLENAIQIVDRIHENMNAHLFYEILDSYTERKQSAALNTPKAP